MSFSKIKIFIILVFIISILALSFLFSNKVFLTYNTWRYGPSFGNFSTYSPSSYGFEENESLAKELFLEALSELITILKDYTNEKTLIGKYDLKKLVNDNIVLNKHYEDNLSLLGIQLLSDLFNQAFSFCSANYFYENYSFLLLKKQISYSVLSMQHKNTHILNITKEKFVKLIEKIRYVDFRFLEVARQKKPDAYAVLTLQEKLSYSTCKKNYNNQIWHEALYYLEYKDEKRLFEQYNIQFENNKLVLHEALENLKQKAIITVTKRPVYIYFLEYIYLQDKYTLSSADQRLRKVIKNYMLTEDIVYLKHLSEFLTDNAPFLDIDEWHYLNTYFLLKVIEQHKDDIYYHYIRSMVFFYLKDYSKVYTSLTILKNVSYSDNYDLWKSIQRLEALFTLIE